MIPGRRQIWIVKVYASGGLLLSERQVWPRARAVDAAKAMAAPGSLFVKPGQLVTVEEVTTEEILSQRNEPL